MLNKYLKKAQVPNEPKENKVFLTKKFGFYDIEAEYENSKVVEEKAAKVLPLSQPIHEEIIREVDEGPPDSSINDLNENDQKDFNEREFDFSKKPFGTLSIFKSPFSNATVDVKKIMDTNNETPIKIQNETKRISMSGMLGLKKITQPELKTLFNPSKAFVDLDDFTETFFNQIPSSSFLAEQDGGKNKMGKNSPMGAPNRISSSMLELEESNNLVGSKELTPNYNEQATKQIFDPDASPFDGVYDPPFKSITEKFERGSSWISEEERKKQVDYLKHISTVKDEITNATTTSPSTSLGDGATRFHKIKTPQQKNIEEEKLKKIETIEHNEKNENPEELAPPTQDKLEINNNDIVLPKTSEEIPEIVHEEKFILKMGEILTESSIDVKPRKIVARNIPEVNIGIVQLKPPYKIKVIIIPTEWPLDISIEEYEKQKSEINSNNNDTNGKSQSSHLSKDDGGSQSGVSKSSRMSIRSRKSMRRTSLKRPKSKSKKPKKHDDASSKHSTGAKKKSNKNLSQPSVDGSKMGGSKLGDAASVAGSVAQSTKKEEKSGADPDKKTQNNAPEPHEAEKNQDDEIVQAKPEFPWSGQEVLQDADPFSAVWLTTQLTESRIWPYGWKGNLANIRWIIRQFVSSNLCENFMNLLVIINTATLAMERYQQPSSESNIMENLNYVFTSIFTAELSLKLFGLGLVRYLSDSLNYLDLMVVIFSWVEIIFLGGSGSISAFRTLRVFRLVRTVRVLRVARLLRGLQSMLTLMEVIANTIGSFGYIGLMLLIIMLIYALFGMTIFAGRWNYPDGLPRPNFDSFNNAFISVFQLLTVENWPVLLYAGLRNQFQPLVALYCISFLMIGNYILLNMFLAIMLDSFVEVSAQQDDDVDEDVFI